MKMSVAAPCRESWERMAGDDRVRHCARCSLNVYNLSSMTEAEAEALVRAREGRLCVRFFERKDGTVLTRDCPEGLRLRRVRRVVAAAIFLVLTGAASFVAGDAANYQGSRLQRLVTAVVEWLDPPSRVEVGVLVVPRPAPPPTTP